MPQRDQHSASDAVSQVIFSPEQDWNDLVEHRLPTDLETQAQALGAFQRARGVSSARVLLRAVLGYVLSLSSLKELSGWGRLVGVTTQVLASQSWHERLSKCGPWLLWLCQHLLGSLLPLPALPTRQRILLVDATHLAQIGPKGDTWRLHSCYNLLAGRLAWVQVSDRHMGEGFAYLPSQPGHILVGDGAYSRASQLVAVDQAKAFSLTRFSPRHLPVYASQAPADTPEFRLDVVAWLTALPMGTFQRSAAVIHQGARLPVRLIAVVLPQDQADALRRQITDGEPLSFPISEWQLDQWACSGLKKVVEGWWSRKHVLALVPELRCLFRARRHRPLKEHQRRRRFLGLLLPVGDLVSIFDCSSA